MIGNGGEQFLGSWDWSRQDLAQVVDEGLHAELADCRQRRLLGREIIVERRLPDPERVGELLGAGAEVALVRKGGGGGVQRLLVAALPARRRVPARSRS